MPCPKNVFSKTPECLLLYFKLGWQQVVLTRWCCRCSTQTCHLDAPLRCFNPARSRKLASLSYPCNTDVYHTHLSYPCYCQTNVPYPRKYPLHPNDQFDLLLIPDKICRYRYHVYGLVVNTMHAMLLGAKSVILPKSVELCLLKVSDNFL